MPTFQPPTVDDVPPVVGDVPPFPFGGPQVRLFGHFKSRARGRTVLLFKNGTCTVLDWPTQTVNSDPTQGDGDVWTEEGIGGYLYSDIARVFTGGHIHYVTDAEAAALAACGGYTVTTCGWGVCPYGEGFYGG